MIAAEPSMRSVRALVRVRARVRVRVRAEHAQRARLG